LISVFALSTPFFVYYYVYPTHNKWSKKSNPIYPTADKVRDEILQTIKGAWIGILPPALSLWLNNFGYGYGYCGVGEYGWTYLIISFFVIWICSDFYEFYYHRIGHTTNWGWVQHKHHHVFYNPTPFSVIADELVDQFTRALPLWIFPMIMPVNMDMLFITFAVFFYFYGVCIHCGHEFEWLSTHNYWINTPFQHYIHHAKSRYMVPYHTGFFIKTWDRLFGSLYDQKCVCAECDRKAGNRTVEQFEKIKIPDYSCLLNWKFWVDPEPFIEKKELGSMKTMDKKLVKGE